MNKEVSETSNTISLVVAKVSSEVSDKPWVLPEPTQIMQVNKDSNQRFYFSKPAPRYDYIDSLYIK